MLPAPQPVPKFPSADDLAKRRIVRHAAISLLVFTALTSLFLTAWFLREPQPWRWQSTLAILCAALGLLGSVAVWLVPSRVTLLGGIGVMVLSLLRVGSPAEWTAASWVLFVLTAILIAPLARAALLLR